MNEEKPDPDMLESYDFSRGLRGKYALKYGARTTETSSSFEERARRVLGQHYGVSLAPGSVPGVHKKFDLVSPDKQIVGEAKYYSLVNGTHLPPAKLAIISEYVWLLEKTGAPTMFLVFGNDRRVPMLWLDDYGALLSNVAFFYLGDDDHLERLTTPQEIHVEVRG